MSKEAMKLALEALQICKPEHTNHTPSRRAYNTAITALREALAQQALDKKAENARELGLDYEPAKDNSNYRFDPPGLDPSHQKPVAWWIPKAEQFCIAGPSGRPFAKAWEPLYTSPQPAQKCKWPTCQSEEYQQALAQEVEHELVGEQPAQQEPVALKWQQAPVKTQWGDDMVVASVAIDKDHTVCLYCERDQTPKVDAMFAQRTWVGLTDKERNNLWREIIGWGDPSHDDEDLMKAIEDASRRKNA